MRNLDASQRSASRLLINTVALVVIFALPVAICCAVLLGERHFGRTVFTIMSFADAVPFSIVIIYITMQYRLSNSRIGILVLDITFMLLIIVFPIIAYWQTRYPDHDRRALLPSLLLILDALPLLFGILWYSNRLPRSIKKKMMERRGYVMTAAFIIGAVLVLVRLNAVHG